MHFVLFCSSLNFLLLHCIYHPVKHYVIYISKMVVYINYIYVGSFWTWLKIEMLTTINLGFQKVFGEQPLKVKLCKIFLFVILLQGNHCFISVEILWLRGICFDLWVSLQQKRLHVLFSVNSVEKKQTRRRLFRKKISSVSEDLIRQRSNLTLRLKLSKGKHAD